LSRILAYGLSALILWAIRDVEKGVRADVAAAVGFVLFAGLLQFRHMKTASSNDGVALDRPMELLRRFPPDLKRLLAADIFARWAEGMAAYFVIIYCVPRLSENPAIGASRYQSILLNIQAATNIILYIIIGPLASREGLAKKPFIGLT